MIEHRNYPRTKVSFPAILNESDGNHEVPCSVKNISEKGICFTIPKSAPYADRIRVGASLHFQFIDNFRYGMGQNEEYLSEDCEIKYLVSDDKTITAGCYLATEAFRKYVIRRQTAQVLSYRSYGA